MMGGSAVMTLIEEQAGRSASVVELMNPACVAVVGASEDRRKFGGRILHLLNNQGFRGGFFRSIRCARRYWGTRPTVASWTCRRRRTW